MITKKLTVEAARIPFGGGEVVEFHFISQFSHK